MESLAVVKTTDSGFVERWGQLRGRLSLEAELLDNSARRGQVADDVLRVRREGDSAVAALTGKYDGIELCASEFRVRPEAMKRAHQQLDGKLLWALRAAIENVRNYQKAIKAAAPSDWVVDGVRLGVRYRAIERVGVCVPGASAPLVSTVIMTVVPAQVAGVKEIAVISSPRRDCDDSVHPAILGLCYELGVSEVYRVSGAQAVAALAFGTETIGKVDKIVGPSNWWGQLAKKEVYGLVGIDSFAGPSEVLILADDSANAKWIAADLLSQAEHAPGSGVLVTDSASLAAEVAKQVDMQLDRLVRGEKTAECVAEYCMAVVTTDMSEAVSLANEFAAEHLQIQCRDAERVAESIVNAGAIFVGQYSPVAVGDYFAGPSHTLPTGGSSRFFGALSVNDFLKQSSVISYEQAALRAAADSIITIADAEGLDGHAKSVKMRINNEST